MIIVKESEWSQTENEVFITVPIKGSLAVDILTNENFIKIHSAPYYFESFLLRPINEEESCCQKTNTGMRFCLKKIEPTEWETLERQFSDKDEKIRVKKEIIEKIQEKSKEKLKSRLEEKEKIKREQVDNSLTKDAEVREKIETMRKLAIEHGMAKVEAKPEKKPKQAQQSKKIEVPNVRKSASIEIQFSKRNFVTPKRESQDPNEQEWLRRQAEARKEIGFVAEDLRPEERDPMFLKEKGDEFYRQKNYLAAISAYTTGVNLAGKCYELYLNRSAAHLAQENYQRCAEDCTKALELLNPPVPSNLKARTQAIARRGAALCKLGFIRQAYDEFVAAIKLNPTDEILKRDAEMLRSKLEAE